MIHLIEGEQLGSSFQLLVGLAEIHMPRMMSQVNNTSSDEAMSQVGELHVDMGSSAEQINEID